MAVNAPLRPAPAPPAPRVRRRRLLVFTLSGAQFLSVLSSTIVALALPELGRSLHATPTGLQWTVDAFVLVWASLLVAAGVLGDRHGHSRLFLIGLSVFALASLADGLAPSIGWLIGARLVQGLGPAMLTPSSLAILSATAANPRERAAAIGLWSAGSGLGMALGPLVGGGLVAWLGWRSVFLINVPVSLALIAMAAACLPRHAALRRDHPFDRAGAALSVLAVAGVVFGLIEGQDRGWTDGRILAAFAVGAAALTAFVLVERSRRAPLVDVSLFRRGAFSAANVAGLVLFFAFVGTTVFFSIFFQQVQGRSPEGAGLALLPVGAGFALLAPVSGRLVGRVGPRAPMVAGLALAGAMLLALLRLDVGSPVGATWWCFALLGAGGGLAMTPMTTTALAAVGPERAGMASAVLNTTRQLGQALGVAVLGAVIYAGVGASRGVGARMSPAAAGAYVDGLHSALWICGALVLAAAAMSAVLVPAERRRVRSALA